MEPAKTEFIKLDSCFISEQENKDIFITEVFHVAYVKLVFILKFIEPDTFHGLIRICLVSSIVDRT